MVRRERGRGRKIEEGGDTNVGSIGGRPRRGTGVVEGGRRREKWSGGKEGKDGGEEPTPSDYQNVSVTV